MPPQNPILERDGIRFFSNPGLQSSVDKALASATKNSVVLELEKNETGFNAAIATKLGNKWTIVAGYQKDKWGHGIGAKIKWEF